MDKNELMLRRLLAGQVAGALLYADDGELQDTTNFPYIDFLRDSPEEIQRKLLARTLREFKQTFAVSTKPE